MLTKEYLIDSNIIIKIWEKYPSLFLDIENHDSIDFKIFSPIAGELYKKERAEYKGQTVLTDRFIKLLSHIINEDEVEILSIKKENIIIRYDSNKNVYYINGNKLSRNDFSLICICKNYKKYTLVTEDKKIIKSAKVILEPSRVLNFNEFLMDLKGRGVI